MNTSCIPTAWLNDDAAARSLSLLRDPKIYDASSIRCGDLRSAQLVCANVFFDYYWFFFYKEYLLLTNTETISELYIIKEKS